MVDAFEHELIIGDPTTMDRDPPSCRSPNGMLEDSYCMGCGHKLLHASRVYARVFVVNPGCDLWCRDEDVEALKRDLVHSPDVRVWAGKGSTHYVFFDHSDRGKTDLMRELLDFLA